MAKKQYPSKWWQFEKRAQLAVMARKSSIVKDAVSDGGKLAAVAAVAFIAAPLTAYVPILGSMFAAPILTLSGVVATGFSIKNFAGALYHDKADNIIDKEVEKWRKNPTPSKLVSAMGKTLKYAVSGLRIGAVGVAIAGATVAVAAGIVAFGATALAGTGAVTAATAVMGFTAGAIGIASPLLAIGAGVVAAGVGTLTAVKGGDVVKNLGASIKKSAKLSQTGRDANAGLIKKVAGTVSETVQNATSEAFDVAAKETAKQVIKQAKQEIKEPKQDNNKQNKM